MSMLRYLLRTKRSPASRDTTTAVDGPTAALRIRYCHQAYIHHWSTVKVVAASAAAEAAEVVAVVAGGEPRKGWNW